MKDPYDNSYKAINETHERFRKSVEIRGPTHILVLTDPVEIQQFFQAKKASIVLQQMRSMLTKNKQTQMLNELDELMTENGMK